MSRWVGGAVAFAVACGADDSEDCASALCGCWEPAALTVSGEVFNPQLGEPVADVVVRCYDESEPIAVSGADGTFSFAIDTEWSPGCGYARCDRLVFVPPSGSGLVQAEIRTELFLEEPTMNLQYGLD